MKQSKKKEKQRGLSTTPKAHFSAVRIHFPLALLLRCIQSEDDALGQKMSQ